MQSVFAPRPMSILVLALARVPYSPSYEEKQEQGECYKGDGSDGLGSVETLGVEAEDDLMLAGRDDHSAQDIVGTQDVGSLPVDGALPTRIVDVREYSKTLCLTFHLKGKGIGFIGSEGDS